MAYKYGSFQQPRIGSGYQYGGEEPSYINPNGLAAANAQRNATLAAQHQQWQQNNANSMAMRDAQAAYEWRQKADREDQRMRNTMGISPLKEQLADPYSAAYQTVYEDIEAPTGNVSYKTADDLGAGIQMSIGGTDGSAPRGIGISPLVGRRTRREIRPEFAEAYDSWQRTGGSGGSAARSVEDTLAIETGKNDLKKEIEDLKAKNKLLQDQRNNGVRAIGKEADYRADGLDSLADDYATSASKVLNAQGVQAMPPPTSAPQGEIQVDVTTDQMIKSDPTGSIVRGQDGRIYFLPRGTDKRIDITDRYSG